MEAKVSLSLESAQFERGLRNADNAAKSFAGRVSGYGRSIADVLNAPVGGGKPAPANSRISPGEAARGGGGLRRNTQYLRYAVNDALRGNLIGSIENFGALSGSHKIAAAGVGIGVAALAVEHFYNEMKKAREEADKLESAVRAVTTISGPASYNTAGALTSQLTDIRKTKEAVQKSLDNYGIGDVLADLTNASNAGSSPLDNIQKGQAARAKQNEELLMAEARSMDLIAAKASQINDIEAQRVNGSEHLANLAKIQSDYEEKKGKALTAGPDQNPKLVPQLTRTRDLQIKEENRSYFEQQAILGNLYEIATFRGTSEEELRHTLEGELQIAKFLEQSGGNQVEMQKRKLAVAQAENAVRKNDLAVALQSIQREENASRRRTNVDLSQANITATPEEGQRNEIVSAVEESKAALTAAQKRLAVEGQTKDALDAQASALASMTEATNRLLKFDRDRAYTNALSLKAEKETTQEQRLRLSGLANQAERSSIVSGFDARIEQARHDNRPDLVEEISQQKKLATTAFDLDQFNKPQSQIQEERRAEQRQQQKLREFNRTGGLKNPRFDIGGKLIGGTNPLTGETTGADNGTLDHTYTRSPEAYGGIGEAPVKEYRSQLEELNKPMPAPEGVEAFKGTDSFNDFFKTRPEEQDNGKRSNQLKDAVSSSNQTPEGTHPPVAPDFSFNASDEIAKLLGTTPTKSPDNYPDVFRPPQPSTPDSTSQSGVGQGDISGLMDSIGSLVSSLEALAQIVEVV